MQQPVLLVEKTEGIAILTLNRPNVLNALSRELRTSLVRAFREIRDEEETAAVILTGAGRAFCAGLDFKELAEGGMSYSRSGTVPEELNAAREMREFDRPIIAAVNGVAITGGFELALACDIIIASTEARFADTHARVGLLPGWGMSQKLPRLIGISRAKELSFTGNFVSADQAERWGLVNRVVAPQDLMPACVALAKDIQTCEPGVVRQYKGLIDAGYGMSFGDGMRLEYELSRAHWRNVTPESLAERRRKVQERGRKQTG